MLVEGWAYTSLANEEARRRGRNTHRVPFWDPPLLRSNDLAFAEPSDSTLGDLRDRYGVRWLFADLTSADAATLARLADLRYRKGDFGVYELLPESP